MEGMREKILGLVRDYPGLHLRELARQADTSLNLVQYHVQHLEADGLVELALQGGKVQVFPPDIRKAERVTLGHLRNRNRLRIVMVVLENGPVPHGAILYHIRMGKSTLSFHLRDLEEAKVVEKADGGYVVPDEKNVRALLGRYPPTPDAADRMGELWTAFYGKD